MIGGRYREQRGGFRLVEIELGVPGEVDAADAVEVGFAFLFDARASSCSRGAGHVRRGVGS